MASAPSNKIERAHQMYREGRYWEALGFYTEALSMAKTKPQKIALHSNRAACFLKLHDFNKAAEECTSVLELDRDHTGALMLRAQTLVTLKEYHSALFDVNRLIELNPSSEVYQNLQARLKTQLSLAPIPESEAELEEEEEYNDEAEPNRYGDEMYKEEDAVVPRAETVQDAVCNRTNVDASVISPEPPNKEDLSKEERDQKGNSVSFEQERDKKGNPVSFELERDKKGNSARTIPAEVVAPKAEKTMELPKKDPKGWQAIPKPKGHSALDYGRWDRVEDDSSEEDEDDEDDEEESQPQFRFRVRTVGVRSVK